MSSKSCGNALWQFVDKVKSSNIVLIQDELHKIIVGPLGLARDKHTILQTDEAVTVLSRIDPDYNLALRRNVEEIFYEELESANNLLDNLDSILADLQVLLDIILQRIQNDNSNSTNQSLALSCYEDARYILSYLKLKTNVLRTKCSVPLDESLQSTGMNLEHDIEEGDFLFRLSKLELSSSLLEAT